MINYHKISSRMMFLLLILLLSCSKENSNKKLNYSFVHTSTISKEAMDDIDRMFEVSVGTEHVYIYDDIQGKILCFDMDGKLVSKFGEKGKGPGEFLSLSGILAGNNKVHLFDDSKRTFLTIDSKGNFIVEDKYLHTNYPRTGKANADFRIFPTMETTLINKKLHKINNLILDFADDRIDIIETVKEEYNPNLIDLCSEFENRFCFDFSKNNAKIAYTNYGDLSYEINVLDITSNKKTTINKNIEYAKYSDLETQKLKKTLAGFKESYKNDPKLKFVELDNKKPVIQSLSFNNDQLWVSISDDDSNYELFHIYDENLKFIGEVNAKLPVITDFYVRNNNLIIYSRLEQIVSIFKINNESSK